MPKAPVLPSPGTYTGPPPTIDAVLWLKKLGMALCTPNVWQMLARFDLPIIVNCRARTETWDRDGKLELDLQHRKVGGQRLYTTCRIPVSACLEHDTHYVIARILAHLSQKNVELVERTIMSELDISFVSGTG